MRQLRNIIQAISCCLILIEGIVLADGTTIKKTICQGDTDEIKCSDGQVIYVHEAFYGRRDGYDGSCIKQSISAKNCKISEHEAIWDKCDDRKRCSLFAANVAFGGSPGTSPCQEYIYIEYRCDDEDQTIIGSCPEGHEWGEWISSDSPSDDGDDIESKSVHEVKFNVCQTPTAIDVQLKNGGHYRDGQDVLRIGLNYGVSCLYSQQADKGKCSDYRVRYCCAKHGNCMAGGDPHYFQFDNENKMLDFMGKCTYLLSATRGIDEDDDRWFSIETTNEERNNQKSVSYLRSVKLSLRGGDDEIVLEKDATIWLETGKVNEINNINYECGIEGSNVFCLTKYGLRISFNGHTATLKLPGLYRNKVRGICGNFNGDDSDDLVMDSGATASNFYEFAESYETEPCGMITPKVRECSAREKEKWEAACKPLMQDYYFGCSRTVDPKPYYDGCVFDQCATDGDKNDLEAAFAIYAQVCLDNEVRCCNWRALTGMPVMNCPPNSDYQGCGSPCPKTCTNPTASCKEERLIETCVCKPGYLLEGNKCVRPSQCGCITNGIAYSQGEKLELPDLGSIYTCTGPNRVTLTCMKGYRKVFAGSNAVCQSK